MSFWNNDKYLSGLLTDDELGPTEPPKPTVKVQTNGLYSTSGIGAFDVDVPQGFIPSGALPITENGTYDVTEYARAEVDVPQGITPSGTLPITENGTYDVTQYAEAVVNVSGGGGSLPSVISKIDGGSFTPASDTLIGNYTVSHNLGEVPKGVVIFSDHEGGAYSVETVSSALKVNNSQNGDMFGDVGTNGSPYVRTQAITDGSLTTTEWYFKRNNTYYKAGVTYNWLAWA